MSRRIAFLVVLAIAALAFVFAQPQPQPQKQKQTSSKGAKMTNLTKPSDDELKKRLTQIQ